MLLSLLAHHLIPIPSLLLMFYSQQFHQASCTSLLVFYIGGVFISFHFKWRGFFVGWLVWFCSLCVFPVIRLKVRVAARISKPVSAWPLSRRI